MKHTEDEISNLMYWLDGFMESAPGELNSYEWNEWLKEGVMEYNKEYAFDSDQYANVYKTTMPKIAAEKAAVKANEAHLREIIKQFEPPEEVRK